ncbi:alpha/beta hydrolase [Demequina sp. SYSU T00192]|uniref:Alpha/beta hydrolase n=1 Tax=Demequina litoralis TaxID=3051660 RepID=A0ABT8GCU7_9MICO|nr:alpha/beta hydrolase [Demequina sp. SYSU T00192]MDN4476971.1 alpha/beta hydrolase [Demequina sp. SYSU T00192]
MAVVTMPDGTELHYESAGEGEPLVLIHGGFTESLTWEQSLPGLAERFSVVAYDRRAHGHSGAGTGERSVRGDVADLVELVERLDLGPVHVASFSYGAVVAMAFAVERPDLVRRVAAHEPPLLGALAGSEEHADVLASVLEAYAAVRALLEEGDHEGGAALFVDTAIGPGTWASLPQAGRARFVQHAPAFLADLRDPDSVIGMGVEPFLSLDRPLLLTYGGETPPMYVGICAALADALPHVRLHAFDGAGHVPHVSHPEDYVAVTADFLDG